MDTPMKPSLYLQFPALLASLVGAATAAQAAEHWNMSAEQPSSNFITRIASDFARQVKRESKGELDISVSPNSTLFKRAQVKAAVARGDIQLGDLFMSVLSEEDPLYALDSLPFLVTDYDQAKRLWQASRPAIEQRLLKDGVRLLYAVPWPPQSLYSNKPVTRMVDFQGMKFRSYNPTIARMAELIGAVPTTIATEDVPQAFASGQVQAMLTSSATGVDLQAWKFVSHFYDIKAFIPKNITVVNEAAFQRLSVTAQQALLMAAKRAEMQGWELSWALNAYQIRTLERRGLTVAAEAPQEVRAGLGVIGRTLAWEWLGKAGEQGREIIDEYREGSVAGEAK
jgi:TRAP-type C4-dicarboxylate transport system substrate-binding protein